jgi:hypothetical protein
MAKSFKSFEEFWTFYLREHGKPVTRGLHIAGTTLSIGFLAAALAALANDLDSNPLPWLFGAVLAGYGPAWIGHFVFEGNRPAVFEHPLWSFLADLKMSWLWAIGSLEPELEKAGLVTEARDGTSV